MTKVLLKVNVAYPGEFQKVFDSQASTRQRNGERSCSLGSDESNHNSVYGILDWVSEQSAMDFWKTPYAKDFIRDWHSVEAPQIRILRECL